MSRRTSDLIVECYRRAGEAHRMADIAATPSERADFLSIEQRWLSLARSRELWWMRGVRKPPRSGNKAGIVCLAVTCLTFAAAEVQIAC
jgi:hypothetical protein